eukprot:461405_1
MSSTAHSDLLGALQLVTALKHERQLILSIINPNMYQTQHLFNINSLNQSSSTANVNKLKLHFQTALDSISELSKINKQLKLERHRLLFIIIRVSVDFGDLTAQQYSENYTFCKQNRKQYDELTDKRINIITTLLHNEQKSKRPRNTLLIGHTFKKHSKTHNKRLRTISSQPSMRWHRKKEPISDDDLEIVSANRSIRCPLTQCIMTWPMRSIICKHTFQRDAIHNYINRQNQQCQICTFINIIPSNICEMCENVKIQQPIKCPIFGCGYNICINNLVLDQEILNLIIKKNGSDNKNKQNEKGILLVDDGDDYVEILNHK